MTHTRLKRRFLGAVETITKDLSNRMFAEMYQEAVRRRLDGDPHLYNFCKSLERIPVSIETFMDSPDFLGATDLEIWPEVRKALIEINSNWWKGAAHGAYDQGLMMGATGTAKSTISMVSIAYHTYLLHCLKNPQALYGLPKQTSIVFPIMGAKPNVVNKVVYAPLRKFIEAMPWFQKYAPPSKLIDSEMYFEEKNIRIVKAGGDEDAILGEAVIGGMIDEINFMAVVLRSKKSEVSTGRAGMYNQAEQVHHRMTTRKKGRFQRPGSFPLLGIVFSSSSTRYKGDFTDKQKRFVLDRGIRTTYIYDRRQFDVVPADRFSGKTFRFVIGNDVYHDSRVLEDSEVMPEGAWIVDVPIEYLDDFRQKPYDTMRDVLGISSTALSPFIKTRHKIFECVEAGNEMGLQSFLVRDHVILGEHGMPQVKAGTYCANPSRPRFVHIDLSRTGDRCVAEGQRVLLADRTYREIERLRVGDYVVTHTGESLPVAAIHNNGRKAVLDVDVYGWHESLRVTDNHRVWAVRREAVSYANGRLVKPNDPMFTRRAGKAAKARYNYVPEFVEMGTLRPGDFLVTPRPTGMGSGSVEGVPLTYETGYIAGLFAAEGSYYVNRKTEYAQFSLHKNETRIANQLCAFLESAFGARAHFTFDKRSDAVTIRATKCPELVRFLLATVGEYSDRKHLSGAMLTHSQFAAGLSHGYVDGDGCVQYNENGVAINFKVKTVSRTMAESFYWGLVASGFLPGLQHQPAYTSQCNGEEIKHKAVYIVSLSGVDQMEKFRFWRAGASNIPCSQAMGLDQYILCPIQGIKDGGIANVHDITVAENSSYVVGNIVVHNCGIAMLRFEGMRQVQRKNGITELLPVATVEMACSIQPDANNEIDVAEVRSFVQHLKTRYGYPIKGVSYDGVDSRESIQQWRKTGMRASMISVDRTSAPYKQLRDALYDTRINLLDDELVTDEIIQLEYDEDKDKVDHPVSGSKDVSDSICGAYTNMLERRSTWTAAATDDAAFDDQQRATFDERFDEDRRA